MLQQGVYMTVQPPLDLAQEFPELKEKVHALKASDTHFAGLFEQYHTVNHQVNRVEQELDTVSDQTAEELKKKRLKLKDELLTLLRAA
jgi:uncharacterized protein YdcH (DUF465 family)